MPAAEGSGRDTVWVGLGGLAAGCRRLLSVWKGHMLHRVITTPGSHRLSQSCGRGPSRPAPPWSSSRPSFCYSIPRDVRYVSFILQASL